MNSKPCSLVTMQEQRSARRLCSSQRRNSTLPATGSILNWECWVLNSFSFQISSFSVCFPWCLGVALGNVTAGWLYQWGVPALILAVVIATGAILFLLARKHTEIGPTVDEPVETGSRQKYPVANHYILIGWLMIFTVTFVQRPLFTFLPPLFAKEGVSSLWASLPLFMHMAVSAFFGLAMFRFRDFLYRRTPFFTYQRNGVAVSPHRFFEGVVMKRKNTPDPVQLRSDMEECRGWADHRFVN